MAKRELKPDLAYQRAFGRHLRKLREDVGWTQVDLAVHARVSEYQISVIENGHEGPHLQTLKALALALGKYPSELLDFKYPLKPNTDFPRFRKTKVSTTQLLKDLLETEFFHQPRSVRDVIEHTQESRHVDLRSAEVSGILLGFVKKKWLRISSSKGRNRYQRTKR